MEFSDATGVRRDLKQVLAKLWRYGIVLRRNKWKICGICYPTVIAMLIMWLFVAIYNPDTIQLNSTENAFVSTTTPNATTNYFVDSSSGF